MATKKWLDLSNYGMKAIVINEVDSKKFAITNVGDNDKTLSELGFLPTIYKNTMTIESSLSDIAKKLKEKYSDIDVKELDVEEILVSPSNLELIENKIDNVEAPKKRRGRPRKNALPETVETAEVPTTEASVPEETEVAIVVEKVQRELHSGEKLQDNMSVEEMMKHSRYLGMNSMGYSVYVNNGQRFIIQEGSRSRPMMESGTNLAGAFLRGIDERSILSSCDGFIKGLEKGQVYRYGDLLNFVSALHDQEIEADDPRVSEILPYINDAVTKSLSKKSSVLADIHKHAKILQDSMSFIGDLSRHNHLGNYIPEPFAVALHRALGMEDLNDKKIVFKKFDSVSSFSFFPKKTKIISVVNDKSKVNHQVNTLMSLNKKNDVSFEEVSSDLSGSDIQMVNTNPSIYKTLSFGNYKTDRSDYQDVFNTLSERKNDGRSVFVLKHLEGDSEQFKELLNHLSKEYFIEGVTDISGSLIENTPESQNWTVLSIGAKKDEPSASMEEVKIQKCETYDDFWTWTLLLSNERAKILEFNSGLIETVETDIDDNREKNSFQVPYQSMSKLGRVSTMVPRNLEASIKNNQLIILKKHADVDQWIADEMGMSKEQLSKAFSPEQIDALACLIYREEMNYKGGLIADQMGVGKGRVLAGMMWRGILNGNKSLFLTEKDHNIADIIRDFKNIGVFDKINPMILNDNFTVYDDITSEVIMTSLEKEETESIIASKQWPEKYHIILSTYSQFNKTGELPKMQKRRKKNEEGDYEKDKNGQPIFEDYRPEDNRGPKSIWLREVFSNEGENILFIPDESHNASSGTSNVSKNMNFAKDNSLFTSYSSATWGKDGSGIGFYSSLFHEKMDVETLKVMIQKGGPVVQEIIASMLARNGALLSRQLDLSKISFEIVEDTKNGDFHKNNMDALAPILQKIALLSGDLSQEASLFNAKVEQELKEAGLDKEQIKEKMKSLKMSSTSFGSPLYNMSRLFICSLLSKRAAEEAIQSLKNGQKPVIMLENTIQSILEEIMKEQTKAIENGASIEDVKKTPDFKDLMLRMLRQLTSKKVYDPNLKERVVKDAAELNMDIEMTYLLKERFIELLPSEIINADKLDIEDSRKKANNQTLLLRYLTSAMDSLENEGYEVDLLKNSRKVIEKILEQLPQDADFKSVYLRNFDKKLPVNFHRQVEDIRNMIVNLPDLPISSIDFIKDEIAKAGFSCDEITGRTMAVEDGIVVRRKSGNRTLIKNSFNSGELDCVILNAAGATGISLHSSKDFANQQQRVFIELQVQSDINKRIQGFGRVHRYDEVVGPIVKSLVTMLPMELRLLAMSNTKLRKLSANISSNRDHAAIIQNIPDLMNSVGDMVIEKYFEAKPEMLKFLGFTQQQISSMLGIKEDVVVENNPVEQEVPENVENDIIIEDGEQIFSKEIFNSDLTDNQKDNVRWANLVLPRLALLQTEWQSQIISELDMLYQATIEELDARGENPLKQKTIEGVVHMRKKEEFDGINHDDADEFDKVVWKQHVVIERNVEPIKANSLSLLVERGQQKETLVDNMESISENIERNLESLLEPYIPPEYVNLEDAITNGQSKSLIRQKERLEAIAFYLKKLKVGNEISLLIGGEKTTAILTDVTLQNKRSMHLPSAYQISFVVPGMSKPTSVSLHSLLSDPDFEIKDGLNGEYSDILLQKFDESLEGTRLESRVILMENEFKAMMLASGYKIGNMVTFNDEKGVARRGVLVNKKFHENLDFIPAETNDLDIVVPFMERKDNAIRMDRKRVFFSEERKSTFMMNFNPKDNKVNVYLPGPKNPLYPKLTKYPFILNKIDALENKPTTSLKLEIEMTELREFLECLSKSGVRFFIPSSERPWVSKRRQEILLERNKNLDVKNNMKI